MAQSLKGGYEMVQREELVRYCDRVLETGRFRDMATNGLQVEGRRPIRRLAVAVSATQRTIAEAIAHEADLLLVHHGLFWADGVRAITGVLAHRLRPLLVHEINLVAYHLPLDAHPELGNNAQLAIALGLELVEPFAEVYGVPVGWIAFANPPMSQDELITRVTHITERTPLLLPGGPPSITRVAILSGSGSSALSEAAERGCDLLLTGEARETTMALARELGISVLVAGHEATERLGVQALAKHLSQSFGLESIFIPDPNPL